MREMEVFDKDGAGIINELDEDEPATGSQWLSERTTNQGSRCRRFGFHELEL
jgi:hypothetical protein